MFKKVRHNGKPMSKFDMACEIDRIHYLYMVLMLSALSYEELRSTLYSVLIRFASHRLCEFENLQ